MKRVNREENRCRLFTKEREEIYPGILYRYENAPDFFPDGQFERITGGDGNTETFRQFLKDYIRDFVPVDLICAKPYELNLNRDGSFFVRNKLNGNREEKLNESERTGFCFLCFLYTAKFWQEFEYMRDLHYQPKPLVVQNFADRLDASADIETFLDRAGTLNREIVLLK